MHVADRRLVQLWVAVTLGAVCATFFGSLVVLLMLTIIGFPVALLLLQLPAIWPYLSGALIIYAGLRVARPGTARWLLLCIAAVPPVTVGFIVPWWANRVTEQRVSALIAQDHGVPPMLPRGLSIAYTIDRGLGSPDTCWDICQRLLFSRTATSFVQLPLDQLSRRDALVAPVRQFSLGPLGTKCDNSRLQPSYASEQEAGAALPPPRLWDKLPLLAQAGLCLHDDPVRQVRADVLVVEQWNFDSKFRQFRFEGKGSRLSLHPVAPFKRREVYRRTSEGWARVMRRTNVEYATLASPLWLVPAFSFDTDSPTHWEWRNRRVVGDTVKLSDPTRWNGLIANDLSITGLRTLAERH